MSDRDIHRIGGAGVECLRLRAEEMKLDPPGISVLKADSPASAAAQMRNAYPKSLRLDESARVVASTTAEMIRSAGFDVIAKPSKRLPTHHRIIHPDGIAGFSDENLA